MAINSSNGHAGPIASGVHREMFSRGHLPPAPLQSYGDLPGRTPSFAGGGGARLSNAGPLGITPRDRMALHRRTDPVPAVPRPSLTHTASAGDGTARVPLKPVAEDARVKRWASLKSFFGRFKTLSRRMSSSSKKVHLQPEEIEDEARTPPGQSPQGQVQGERRVSLAERRVSLAIARASTRISRPESQLQLPEIR